MLGVEIAGLLLVEMGRPGWSSGRQDAARPDGYQQGFQLFEATVLCQLHASTASWVTRHLPDGS